ncbi:MAG: outer membrane lipoprotein-sorting protein [Fidelibacterota bacterium]
MKRITSIFPILLLGMGMSWGQTGYEIAKMVDDRKEPADMTADLTMVLTNSKGKTRTNIIHTVSKDGGKKQIIWFLSPPDDRGVAFLKIEHQDREDEMRLWLPAFKKVRRISAKKKGDAFMGSDLSYEDLTNRDLEENEYRRLEDETIQGKECYVLEVIPKPEAQSTYSRHVSWIVKTDLTILKEESYDRSGRLKKKKAFQYTKLKSYHLPKEIFVEDVQKKHTTRLTFDHMEVDTGVKASLFQEKNLKRLPR